MGHGLPAPDARGALRVPLGCKVRMRGGDGETHYGICADLSVSGLTVRTSFVPQAGEVIEVCVLPPPQGGRTNPLSARARVVRCHAVDAEYELGLARKNQVIARTPTARTTAVHDCGNPAVRP